MTKLTAASAPLPRAIWALGITSLLMDLSSEMIHGLLPLYITTVMGAGAVAVGLIEGMAEATALIVKIGSGAMSDYLGKRKWLAVLGYGLAAVTKPVFPLAPTLAWVIAARFVDRIGKGIRGAPRDALVADLVPTAQRGAAYGLRQSLDTIGAVLGPLVAVGLMLLTQNDFQLVFWVAVLPAFGSVLVLMLFVPEPERPTVPFDAAKPAARQPLLRFTRATLAQMPTSFWWVTAFITVLSVARISEAFFVLRLAGLGLPVAFAPFVLVAANLVYATLAYPFGKLADAVPRQRLLGIGIILLILSYGVLAMAPSLPIATLGLALWGAHMALTQGLLAAMVADSAPDTLRGTAFGMFNLASGLAMLVGNVGAGLLWDAFGPAFALTTAAVVAAAALPLLLIRAPRPSML